MAKFSIVPYLIRVKHRGHAVDLSSFNSTSLETCFEEFITSLKAGVLKNDETETALDCSNSIKAIAGSRDSFIIGLLRSGRYGEESEIVELATGTTLDFVGRDKSNMSKFFFALEIPESGRDEAILILQTYKTYGIKTQLEREWKAYFRSTNKGYSLEINPLVPAEYIKSIVNRSIVKEIRLIKFNPKSSKAIDAMTGGHSETIGILELSAKAKKKSGIPINKSISTWLDQKDRSANNLIEMSGDLKNIDFNEVKIELDDSGTHRTLRLSSGKTPQFKIDLNDNVKIDVASGLPNFDSLASFSIDASYGFRKSINIGDNQDDSIVAQPAPEENRVLRYV